MLCFLRGGVDSAGAAIVTSRQIIELRERDRASVAEQPLRTGLMALESFYTTPVKSIGVLAEQIDISISTASTLVGRFEEMGILREITGRQRDRLYRYDAYVDIFRRD